MVTTSLWTTERVDGCTLQDEVVIRNSSVSEPMQVRVMRSSVLQPSIWLQFRLWHRKLGFVLGG